MSGGTPDGRTYEIAVPFVMYKEGVVEWKKNRHIRYDKMVVQKA